MRPARPDWRLTTPCGLFVAIVASALIVLLILAIAGACT